MNVREVLYSILFADAQLSDAGFLGALLDKRDDAPHGVYLTNPPEEIEPPFIVHSPLTASERLPKLEFHTFTIYSNDWEAIADRIHVLLEDQPEKLSSATDLLVKMLRWNWSGPVIFDDGLKIYTRVERYLIKGLKQ